MNIILFCILFFLSCSESSIVNEKGTILPAKQVQANEEKTYYGKWEVIKFYSPPLIAALENYMKKSEAKTYLNKIVIFQKNETVIFGSKCTSVDYFESKEKAYNYFYYNYRMVVDTVSGKGTRGLHPEQLGVKSDSVDIIEISCNDIYYNFFVVNSNELMVEYKSTFFFLKKIPFAKKSFVGSGKSKEELSLTGEETSLKLSYDFYTESDQLIIEDEKGNQLFSTEMLATNGVKEIKIPLLGVTKLVFKVKASKSSSKWKFTAELY